jgi:gas vesicle protein
MNSNNRFFEGLFLGGLVGFLFGLLYAPKSGSQLRKELADQSDELYRQASTNLTDLKERTGQQLQSLQTRSDQIIKQATQQVQETRDQLTSRIQDLSGNSNKQLSSQEIE